MLMRFLRRDPVLAVLIALLIPAVACELLLIGGPLPLLILLTFAYVVVRLVSPRLASLIARIGISLQWKIVTTLGVMALLYVSVALINFEAMDYMHVEMHELIDNPVATEQALQRIRELEETQHGFLFSAAPLFAMLGALVAVIIGAAIAISVIEPLQRMKTVMKRIAQGDLSERIEIRNRDELGELAAHINHTSAELARLQEATLAEERSIALRDRVMRVTAAQEDERRRISRELHDGLGPSLAVVANRLHACQQLIQTAPAAAEQELESVTRTLRDHIQEIRLLINDLRPLTLDQLGLAGAVRQQGEQFASETGIAVLSIVSADAVLNPLAEVTVFRVLQECFSNIKKHARATQVEVYLRDVDGGIELTVRDDGRGFESGLAATGLGVGLVGMRERAELIGGRLKVRSAIGRGCEIALFVAAIRPMPDEEVLVGVHPAAAG